MNFNPKFQKYIAVDEHGNEVMYDIFPYESDLDAHNSVRKFFSSMSEHNRALTEGINIHDPILTDIDHNEIYHGDYVDLHDKETGQIRVCRIEEQNDGSAMGRNVEDDSLIVITNKDIFEINHDNGIPVDDEYDFYDDYACENFCCACCGCVCDFYDPDEWEKDETE